MRLLRKWGPIAGIAVIVLAIGAYFFYAGSESTDDAQLDGHITQVSARVGGIVRQVNVTDSGRGRTGLPPISVTSSTSP